MTGDLMAENNEKADARSRAGGLSDAGQLATFRIGDELFGLGIDSIREIVRYPDVTAVPRSPAYLTGLANMRGNVLPVVDARIRLGKIKVEKLYNNLILHNFYSNRTASTRVNTYKKKA